MIVNKIIFISYVNLKYLFLNKHYIYIYIYIYLLLINIYFYCLLFLRHLTRLNFVSYIEKKNIKSLIIQRAPMAHRRWSQEHYKIQIYYWINYYRFLLKYNWIHYFIKNTAYLMYYLTKTVFYLSTTTLFIKSVTNQIQIIFVLYY
jgi:hypothetical protein